MADTPTELLARLDYSETGGFPKAAMREIIARQDEMTPYLIDVLKSAHGDPREFLDGPKSMLATYTAYLLAQFRETGGYRPLLALLNLGDGHAEALFGDSITEDMSSVVAGVFDGDEAPLRALIENPRADEYARACAGLQSYPALLHFGRISAGEVERYFHDLLDHKLEREPSYVWDNLCTISSDLGFAALLPLIRKAFDEGLCDPGFDSFERVEARLVSGGDARWSRAFSPVDDVVGMMETWACFAVRSARRPSAVDSGLLAALNESRWDSPAPVVPAPPKYPGVGRNEPCPCGSGRKFKKCCGGAG